MSLHRCGKLAASCRAVPRLQVLSPTEGCGQPVKCAAPVDSLAPSAQTANFSPAPLFAARPDSPHEAHLPAERSQTEAQARLPRAYVDARRPRDPEGPARQGSQAALRVARRAAPEPAFPLPRLRRGLPSGPVRGHALPRPLLVRA